MQESFLRNKRFKSVYFLENLRINMQKNNRGFTKKHVNSVYHLTHRHITKALFPLALQEFQFIAYHF
ncbi:hypothetical protein SAMN05518672_101981 [Chitinophaga sp. CF118]|nr:hypothetical protein SAMN05518672_101981 [Chitinophaga sp. CF118]